MDTTLYSCIKTLSGKALPTSASILRTDHKDSCTLLLHQLFQVFIPFQLQIQICSFEPKLYKYIIMYLKKTTTQMQIFTKKGRKVTVKWGLVIVLNQASQEFPWGGLSVFSPVPNHMAVYASSEPTNTPLSTRCAFSVLKMCSCWSGLKVKNCWISLLGLGPLKHKSIVTSESQCSGNPNAYSFTIFLPRKSNLEMGKWIQKRQHAEL